MVQKKFDTHPTVGKRFRNMMGNTTPPTDEPNATMEIATGRITLTVDSQVEIITLIIHTLTPM